MPRRRSWRRRDEKAVSCRLSALSSPIPDSRFPIPGFLPSPVSRLPSSGPGGLVMSIWVGKGTRLLVQGLTGREGTFHALASREYGTQVVAGVTPGKGGTTHEGIPVFNTVSEAVTATGANASMIFVPPPFAADAIVEAADGGVGVIACITEGIPVNDMLRARAFLDRRAAADKPVRLIGPN